MEKEKIAAVILTFNRLDLLKELLPAVINQTRMPDEIYVVNNSSTDGTTEWLNKQDGITVITQENTGSSGGQFTGIKVAFDGGYNWIWTMDDDVLPDADCLEKLIKNKNGYDVVAPLRFTSEGKPFLNDVKNYNLSNPFSTFWKDIVTDDNIKDEIIEAVGITFEGPMMKREVIRKIGLPEKKFFIFGDDTEYFIRADKAGFKISIITGARLNRKLEPVDPRNKFNWKNFYIIRNIIAIDVLHGNFAVRILRPIGYLIKWLLRSRSFSDVNTTLKAFFDGYFYRSDN